MDFNWLSFLDLGPLSIAYAFSGIAICRVLLLKTNPRAALAWTVALIFLPWVGVILYAIFGIGRAESRAARLMRKAHLKAVASPNFSDKNARKKEVFGRVKTIHLPVSFVGMSSVGRKLTGKPLTGGNAITPLYYGDAAYAAMLSAIDEAEDYVYMTTYIFNGGDVGESFVLALKNAAQRGVDVRLLVDGLGKWYSWSKPWQKLKGSGVKVTEFLPLRIFPLNVFINLRNHRKVLVADDRGFTGGMNIADYFKQSHESYAVQDVHFLCSGPIVNLLREAFLLDWGFCTNDYSAPIRAEEEMCGDVLCRVVLDGPGTGTDPLHDLIFSAIAAAKEHVRIMTPYFLPSHEVMGALRAAALRGVKIDIILPSKNNILPVHLATFHLLPQLLEVDINIYFQEPPFAHTKLFIVDNYYVQIGSANFDARSLRLNFELNVECFDLSLARQMLHFFDATKAESRPYTKTDTENRSLPKKLLNASCWLFSPYL